MAKLVKFSPSENIWLNSRYMWVVQVEIKYSVKVKIKFNADINSLELSLCFLIANAMIRVRLRV